MFVLGRVWTALQVMYMKSKGIHTKVVVHPSRKENQKKNATGPCSLENINLGEIRPSLVLLEIVAGMSYSSQKWTRGGRCQNLMYACGSVRSRPNRTQWRSHTSRQHPWYAHTKFEQKISSQSKVRAKKLISIYSTVNFAIPMGREGPLSHPATSEVNVSAKWYIDISFFALPFDCEEIFCSNLVCAHQGCWRDVCGRHWVRFGLDRTKPHAYLRFWHLPLPYAFPGCSSSPQLFQSKSS